MVARPYEPQLSAGHPLDFLLLLFGLKVSLKLNVSSTKLVDRFSNGRYFLARPIAIDRPLAREQHQVKGEQDSHSRQEPPRGR